MLTILNVSYDGASSSVIDHFVMSNEVAYAVCKGYVVHDVDNLSNHNVSFMHMVFILWSATISVWVMQI